MGSGVVTPTHRMIQSQEENEHQLRLNIDLVAERRELAAIREAKYKKSWKNTTTLWSRRSFQRRRLRDAKEGCQFGRRNREDGPKMGRTICGQNIRKERSLHARQDGWNSHPSYLERDASQ
ncbi:hypothetical protein HanRHA438_Chr03g0107611 [Helianthus annuus]|nr:hypothetical protein HanRHA438_Chr03g0107611 [Helianthus annuus]